MPFPFPNLWSNNHLDDAIDRIDRHLGDRAQRLFAGISVAPDFGVVHGVLMSSRGRGKFLRVNQVLSEERQVPSSISDSLRVLTMESGSEVTSLAQATADLAVVQAEVIEELKIQAGKYVDRLLTVAVDDPGHWSQDFDGQVYYSSLCDRHRLSELCGLNVIDAFPARDLAVGGNGQMLEALPLWILLADRNERIAHATWLSSDLESKPEFSCFRPRMVWMPTCPRSSVFAFQDLGLYENYSKHWALRIQQPKSILPPCMLMGNEFLS